MPGIDRTYCTEFEYDQLNIYLFAQNRHTEFEYDQLNIYLFAQNRNTTVVTADTQCKNVVTNSNYKSDLYKC